MILGRLNPFMAGGAVWSSARRAGEDVTGAERPAAPSRSRPRPRRTKRLPARQARAVADHHDQRTPALLDRGLVDEAGVEAAAAPWLRLAIPEAMAAS
jgi:hypothetical protein